MPRQHTRIADAIVKQIRAGELRPGKPLPAIRAIAEDHHVSRGPVSRALRDLERAGMVQRVPGYPYYVTERM